MLLFNFNKKIVFYNKKVSFIYVYMLENIFMLV